MAKIKSKTKDCQLIVITKLSFGEKLNEVELDVFSRKYVRGLLKASRITPSKVEYRGPVGISLCERLKKPVSKYDFFFIMEQIVDLEQKLSVAQLKVQNVVPDMNKIYINEQTKELQFIYLPLISLDTGMNLFDLMYRIIYSTIPMLEQDDGYISRFAYFLRGLSFFDSRKIEKYIEKEDRKVVNIIKKHYVGQSGFMTDKQRDYYKHYDSKEVDDEATEFLVDDEATGFLIDDEATGFLIEDEATGILNEKYNIHYPSLYRIATDETISINKPVFRLGKEKSYSDYFIGNNNAVSRSHADVITRGERYYIMDLNSTNKTFINGTQIVPKQENEIFNCDKIKLGNEEFVFYT